MLLHRLVIGAHPIARPVSVGYPVADARRQNLCHRIVRPTRMLPWATPQLRKVRHAAPIGRVLRIPRLVHEIANELDIRPDGHAAEALLLIGATTFYANFIVRKFNAWPNLLLVGYLFWTELVAVLSHLRQQRATCGVEVRRIRETSD